MQDCLRWWDWAEGVGEDMAAAWLTHQPTGLSDLIPALLVTLNIYLLRDRKRQSTETVQHTLYEMKMIISKVQARFSMKW